ncbi:MAG: type sorting protein, partial [Bacteroidota bacterium]|nr:type sorting protein [Bacteroidota bacterium]
MKKCLLLVVLTLAFAWVGAIAKDDGKGDELLRKAKLAEPSPFIYNTSFPRNFTEIGNPINAPAVSTGYYFVDSDDEAPDYWRPIPEIIDTNTERTRWTKIMSGPRVIRDPGKDYKDYWNDNKEEGMRFFRNPAIPNPATLPADSSYFSVPGGDATDIFATDSTDDAFAGPMPIGFRFYFNGIGFDSFYVSTNGIICLTNRRYFYNSLGEKTVPAGSNDAYDPMSNDWYARGRSYADGGGGPGTGDATGDDYGYYYSVCGGSPTSSLSGIRMRGGALNNLPNRAAVIAPFFGDLHLSQYWASQKRVDMFGQVQYYRPSIGGKLIIYIMNIEPMRNMNTPYGTYYANPNLRGGDGNYTSASAQVVLNRSDSSVTVIYEKFEGVAVVGGRGVPANTIFRYNTTVGVRGYARHVNYDQPGGPTYPWGGDYEQYTHYFSNYADPNQSYPHNYLAIKFKQWKNTIRVVDIQYRVRKQDANADLLFTESVKSSLVNDYELLAGDERIGAIQPVC